MGKIKLLFVEDDFSFAESIKLELGQKNEYDILIAKDGRDGLDTYRSFKPDIIVAEIKMPVMDGREMVRRIRENDVATPIIFSTHYKEPHQMLDGMKDGVTVYITKPYLTEFLDYQIRSILRLVSKMPIHVSDHETYTIGSYCFCAFAHTLIRYGKKEHLTVTETKILEMLVKNAGKVVARNHFLKKLEKKEDDKYSSRTLDVHIVSLRKKLKNDPAVEIVTIRNEGYMLKN